VCNVGDMLQRLTNLRLRSTTHRVTNPPHEVRQQRALFAAVLPAFQPGFPHQDTAAMHRRATSRSIPRADQRT
jgi:isopenicillin N synthase-like dioxygenase